MPWELGAKGYMCTQLGLPGLHYIHSTSQQCCLRGSSIKIHLKTWLGTWDGVRAQNTHVR